MNRSKIKMDSSDVENDTVMCGISNKTGLIKSHGVSEFDFAILSGVHRRRVVAVVSYARVLSICQQE